MPLSFDQIRERLNGASSVTVGNIAYLNQWVYGRSHDNAAVEAVKASIDNSAAASQLLPQGWSPVGYRVNPATGYKAIALKHDASNVVVIAQAGTGGPELADWGQNTQLRSGINAVDLILGGPGRALVRGAINGTQVDDGIAFLEAVLDSQNQNGMPLIIVSGHSLGGGVAEGVVAWARASNINNVTGVGFMSAPFPLAVRGELAERGLALPADLNQHVTHYVAESDILYNFVGHDFYGRVVKHGGIFELSTRHFPVIAGPGGELFRTERRYWPSMLATHGSFAELVNATGSSTNSFVRTPLGNLVPIPGGLYPSENLLDQRRFEQMRGWFAMQDVLENILGTGAGWGEIDTSGTLRYSKDGGAVQTVTNYVNGGLGTPFRVESTSSKTSITGGVATVAGTVEEVVVTGARTGGVIRWALNIAGDTLAFLGGPADLGAIMNGVMRENMTSGAMYYPPGSDPDDPRRYFIDPNEPMVGPWTGPVDFTPRELEDMPFLGRAVLYNLDVVGATLGSYLGDGDRARGIAYSSLLGEIGGRLSDAIKAGQPVDWRLATAGGLDALGAGVATRAAQAGIGAVSSWLTMELGEALGIDGFGAELFNAAVGGVTNKILLNLADEAFGTFGIFRDLNPGGLPAGGGGSVFSRSLGSFLGAKLGSMVVPPNTQAAVVLSSIGSAVGAAALSGAAGGGAAAALSGAISTTLGLQPWIVGNLIAPGIGAFVGFVLGALAGNLFGSRKPKTPMGSAETALQIPYARYEVGPATIANKGNAWLVDTMATSARDALNSLISVITFDDPDAFVANVNGVQTDQRYGHSGSNIYVKINGVQHDNFASADRAVDFGSLAAIRNTMVVGGDLFSKRALAHSPAEDLLSLAGDLQVAADYRFYRNNEDLIEQIIVEAHGLLTASEEEYYKQNKAWIDIAQVQGPDALAAEDRAKYDANLQTVQRIMAANDAQAVANPWIVTLQRAAELNLDKVHASDFHGGLRGYVDSFATSAGRLAYEDFSIATGVLANPGPRPGSDMNGQGAFVVFAGQSNMGGYGVSAKDVNSAWRPDPLTKIWDPAAGAWVQMNPGVNTGYSTGALQSAWGPEVNFAINFRATYPNEPLYIVKSVHGGTSIAADWTPSRSDGLFASTSSLINAASAALGGRRPEHLMWGQGEGDAENAEWANAYQQNLTAFLGAVRSQWLSDAGAEVALFQINTAPAFDAPVRSAQLAVDQAQANTLSFDANGFARAWPDELHFSNVGLDSIGRSFFDAFKTWHGAGTSTPPTGSPSTPPPTTGTGVVVTSDQHADTLTGTAGNDTLNSGVTSDTMTGGAGSDHFVFNTVPWSPATITDFAVNADKIDVRGLLPSTVTDPLAQGYVALFADESGGTKVVLDPTGPSDGAFFDKFITVLSGVAHTAVTANNFIVGGSGTTPPPGGTGVVVTSDQHADTLTGTSGNDTLNSGVTADTMSGGAGSDHFVFNTVPWSPATITDFEVGLDKIDLRGLLPANYNGDLIADGYVALFADEGGGTKVVMDPTGAADGAFFDKFVTRVSGVAHTSLSRNDFLVGSGTTTPPPTGGGGVVITSGQHADTLVGTAGADTLISGVTSDTLTGGEGADHFVFNTVPWSPATITDFRIGVDKIDLRGLLPTNYAGDPIADGFVALYADEAGGTKVVMDPTGASDGAYYDKFVTYVRGVAHTSLTRNDFLVGAGATTPPPGGTGVVVTSDQHADTLTGTSGNDTLNSGVTADTMSGGAGSDHFVFNTVPWSPATITDFEVGLDKIDLRGLLPANYNGDLIADGYVALFADEGGGTKVVMDPTGAADGAFFDKFVTRVSGVAHTSLSRNDFLVGSGTTTPPPTGGGGEEPPLLPVADAITIVRSGAAATGFFSVMPGSNAAGDAISLEQFLGGASGYTAAGSTGMGGDNYRNESAATEGKIILDLGDDGSTGGDDIFIGSDHADRLEGRTGWDWLDGRAGNDTLAGGQHQDVLIGGQGADQLEGALGDDYLAGGDDHDKLYGADGADVMVGGAGSDELRGDGGDDILLADDDAAPDTLDGGDGADAVSYERFEAAVIADLRQAGLHGDVWTSIEGLIGGAASDQLIGNSTANRLQGGNGADTLSGLESDDDLEGGAGADRLEGGEGRDTASYEDSQIGVDVDLALVRGAGGDADGDSYFSIEDVRGSRFSDRLRGGEGDNRLFGMAGNDWIMASAGTDRYDGGAGNDIIDYTLATGPVQAYLGSGLATQPVSGSGAFTGAEHQLEGFETVIGSAFADTLSAGLGNQTFVGGRGDDSLSGGVHSDTYVWARGDGVDNIAELDDGWNELKLTGDVGFSDLILGTAGGDQGFLEVHVRNDAGYLRVNGNWRNADVPLIKALSVGESRLELSSGLNAPLSTAADDTMRGKDSHGDLMFGFDGNDVMQTREHPYDVDFIDHVLVGGRGDDLMTSSAGNDQYAFERGDGFDVILFDHGGEDTLVFGASVAADDIIFKVDGDDLYVGVRDLNNPQLDAMQVSTRVHITGGAVKYVSQQSGLEYHVIERIEAGGSSMDLRKMDIPWSRVQSVQYDYVRPIVFDLESDGLDLTTVDSSTVVAKTDDGVLSRVAWVGPTEGLLAFDRNGDGDINHLSEISFVQDLKGATTDLEGLRSWDTNNDGRLDARDEGWGKLQIWTDRNQNGRSTEGELRTLDKAGIEAIDLTGEATGYDPSLTTESYVSNTIRYETKKGSGTAYDVALARRLINSEGYYAGEYQEEWGELNEDGELGLLLNDPKADALQAGKKPAEPTKTGVAGRVLEYDDVAAAAKVDFSDNDLVDRKVAERWDYRLDSAKAAAWKEREAKSEYDRGKIDVLVGRNKANSGKGVGSAASITALPDETPVAPRPEGFEPAQDPGAPGSSRLASDAKNLDVDPMGSTEARSAEGSARRPMLGRGSADGSDWWRRPTSLGEFLETGTQLGRTVVPQKEPPSRVSARDDEAVTISLMTQQLLLQQAVAGFSDGTGFAPPIWRAEEQHRHHELAASPSRSIAA